MVTKTPNILGDQGHMQLLRDVTRVKAIKAILAIVDGVGQFAL